jgi:DNA polymerase-4
LIVSHRKIIHLDLDAFFCAVEEKHNPSLRGLAFAVGGRPDERGVVASCSYAARKYGVRSAMPMSRAIRLCPHLSIIPGNHMRYSQASKEVMAELQQNADLVEQISIDEAFLDVTNQQKSIESIARSLQSIIREKFDLPCSLGAASNKLVAKIATDVGKAAAKSSGPPNAIQIVPPGQEAAFLAPLPCEALWGVGPKTASRLTELSIHSIGDIAQQSEADLVRWFGKHGHDLYLRSRGIDERPLEPVRETKSVSKETTFAHDINDRRILLKALDDLSKGVERRLKKEDLAGTTIKLKLRWSDFTTLTRQQTLDIPTDDHEIILKTIHFLFNSVWDANRPVRLLGVGVSGLEPPIRQLTLWDYETEQKMSEKEERLTNVVQTLKEKFGNQVIDWGNDDA